MGWKHDASECAQLYRVLAHGTAAQSGLDGASRHPLKRRAICSVSQTVLSEQSMSCPDVELLAAGLHPYDLPWETPVLTLWLFAFLCQHDDVRHRVNVSLNTKHLNASVPSVVSLWPKHRLTTRSMQTVQLDRARRWTGSVPVWTCHVSVRGVSWEQDVVSHGVKRFQEESGLGDLQLTSRGVMWTSNTLVTSLTINWTGQKSTRCSEAF